MALKIVDRYSIENKCHISVKRYLMDIVDYVSFKEVFCSIMGIKSSPNNASDDLTCHLNLSYRIEEEFDPEISDFEKTIKEILIIVLKQIVNNLYLKPFLNLQS